MTLNSFFTFFVPKDKIFFNLFEKASANLLEVSKALQEVMAAENQQSRAEAIKKVGDLEHVGDELTHEIFTELSSNFITPFDREDIHYLASSLDDIIDFIYASSKRIDLYNIEKVAEPMKKMANIIELLVMEISKCIPLLRNMKNYRKIRESIVHINYLENQADDLFSSSIAELFDNEKDAIQIIKFQEIMSHLEIATDKCEDVANVIESILIKNS